MMSEYQVPRVWSAADSNQGKFSGINRPLWMEINSGATL